MSRTAAIRLALPLALGVVLAGCNLLPQDETAEAPPGTTIEVVDPVKDIPVDEAGKPVDKGEGPVLQSLGSIAAVDLGPRKGGCTFQHADGRELMITGASADKGVAGTGAVRTGGIIVMLKAAEAVGLDGLKTGTRLTNGKITLEIARGKNGTIEGGVTRYPANLGVTDAEGRQRIYSPGTWICA